MARQFNITIVIKYVMLPSMSIIFIIIYLTLGAIVGTLAGLLGIGGGLLTVPALLIIFGYAGFDHSIIMHMAAGTSLMVMVITTLSSAIGYYRANLITWHLTFITIPGIVVGAWIGPRIAVHLSTEVLTILVAAMASIAAIKMFIGKTQVNPEGHLPTPWIVMPVTLAIAVVSSMVGIGGGLFFVPFLTYSGVAIRRAIAVSASCTVPIAIVAAISFITAGKHTGAPLPAYCWGYVYLPAAVSIALTSMIGAQFGVRLNQKLHSDKVKKFFAIFMLVIAIKLVLIAI